ncbi:MAG TPA: hypothetical protein P5514_11445 [Bacteroidales bacterium]|nr:hypothetical protein [Bacteroidales bacterium]HRX97552.1 hypothetical protein [Bacteroidales bacterium]
MNKVKLLSLLLPVFFLLNCSAPNGLITGTYDKQVTLLNARLTDMLGKMSENTDPAQLTFVHVFFLNYTGDNLKNDLENNTIFKNLEFTETKESGEGAAYIKTHSYALDKDSNIYAFGDATQMLLAANYDRPMITDYQLINSFKNSDFEMIGQIAGTEAGKFIFIKDKAYKLYEHSSSSMKEIGVDEYVGD